MKLIPLIFLFVYALNGYAQSYSSAVYVTTVYSQNEKYFLRSVPYDNEEPSLRGKTSVYETGKPEPLYVFERGFDSVTKISNNLILSDDGETIFFLIPWGADDEKEGLKSISVYKNGQMIRSFTEKEITECDYEKERCDLLYSNYSEVVDKEASNPKNGPYKKILKAGTNDQERFLSDFPIFTYDGIVYLTDSKRKVHSFDLKDGKKIESVPFESIFARLSDKGRFNKITLQGFGTPIYDFPKLKDGTNTQEGLARFLGMKTVDWAGTRDQQYKQYRVRVSGFISRDGSIEVTDIESFDGISKEKMSEFFQANKFDANFLPAIFDRWFIREEYFYFRKSSNQLARKEKQQELIDQKKNYEKRLTLESIDGRYIPKDLGECLAELDKTFSEVDKNEVKALPKRNEMIRYHMGLGMWMRNNWGLWGGSRLQKYFHNKGIRHPDDMSSVVLFFYYDWLKGDKDSWKTWDKDPKSPF